VPGAYAKVKNTLRPTRYWAGTENQRKQGVHQ